jgi:hypothetical protein
MLGRAHDLHPNRFQGNYKPLVSARIDRSQAANLQVTALHSNESRSDDKSQVRADASGGLPAPVRTLWPVRALWPARAFQAGQDGFKRLAERRGLRTVHPVEDQPPDGGHMTRRG